MTKQNVCVIYIYIEPWHILVFMLYQMYTNQEYEEAYKMA